MLRLFVLPCLVAIVGCVIPVEESTTDKDGFIFERPVLPEAIEVNKGTYSTTFSRDRYVAVQFDIDAPTRLTANAYADYWFRYEYGGHMTMHLFREDEDASSGEPMAKWDLITTLSAPENYFLGFPTSARPQSHDIHAPGTYMMLLTAPYVMYRQQAQVFIDLTTSELDVEGDPFGKVELTLYHFDPADLRGHVAAGVRVAVGTSEAVTDSDGHVVLDRVEAGEQLIKLGPFGLLRPSAFREDEGPHIEGAAMNVIGGGYAQGALVFMRTADFIRVTGSGAD